MCIAVLSLCSMRVDAADSDASIIKKIDEYIRASWENNDVKPSDRSEDGEFARRVALDVVGHIPDINELTEYLEDPSPDRRRKFVDQLLDQDGYIRNWTTIWGNLLVGRANRRAGNREPLEKWLRTAFYKNLPYDKFVEQLMTAEGDADENGAVVFLASHLNEMQVPATSITAKLFLGRQVQCTQCHNHPFNDWQQSQFWGMNAFFKGTQRKGGRGRDSVELSDEMVTGIVNFEKRNGVLQSALPTYFDGTIVESFDKTPRKQLATFMLDPKRPYLAEAIINRMWGHFFGYGFTKPIDDMGPHNMPSHPELLAYLTKEFQDAGYDLKRLIRWIAGSEAYQLSSRTHDNNKSDDPAAGEVPLFSHMYLKQFRAEQLYDSLLIATTADKAGRNSEQAEAQRRQWAQQFVQTFGTDENDEQTTFNGTIPQALVLMNGQLVQNALSGAEGGFLRRVLEAPNGIPTDKTSKASPTKGKPTPKSIATSTGSKTATASAQKGAIPRKIEALYLVALARRPTEDEMKSLNAAFQKGGYSDPIVGLQDVFWALLNSNEFIINH